MDPLKTLALMAFLMLGACGAATEPTTEASPTATIRSAVATLGASRDDVTVYGAAEAGPGGERSVISMREALLVAILAPTGTAVSAGQPIATLKPSPSAALDLARASSDATTANAALARALRLRADGLVSDADVETARAAARTATAAKASSGSGSGVLRAPVAGTVQSLTAKPGDQIAAGASVASVAATGERRARFGVDPAVSARIHPGQQIRIEPISGGAPIIATVVGVDPAVDAATRLASVFARVPASVSVGTPLRGHVAVGASVSGVTIPYAALLDEAGQSFVFVVNKGAVKKRNVSPGSTSGEAVTILTGLQPGERVVTEGGTALEDGMKVREDRLENGASR
ncbi:efflux RND transporter periplasmic adaptor subunit [Sphingomonas paeninsulae]|uniref:Efflux RND transporter periplasmic adaptor subunit n=1 Tax=Sphingomonas paeninsulae TaxID=2319844 RepID=A0A494TIN7_SPHPE|nr:efflux RND transporter periplasmic adaptor subunit [Sphingomonas paeninsulae]